MFQKYATIILGVGAVGAGGLAALLTALTAPTATSFTRWVAALQFLVLVVGAVGTYVAPLVPTGWQGRFKTGLATVAAVIVFAIPFVTATFSPVRDIPLIAVGLINILVTELGVQIRTDTPAPIVNAPVDAPTV